MVFVLAAPEHSPPGEGNQFGRLGFLGPLQVIESRGFSPDAAPLSNRATEANLTCTLPARAVVVPDRPPVRQRRRLILAAFYS